METVFALLVLALVVLFIAAKTICIVPQASVILIERLGKFDRLGTSGLQVVIPFFERPRAVFWSGQRQAVTQIDLREQFTDLPPQPVISRDNVTFLVDSVIYWQITDPTKSVYEVSDLVGGIIQLTITAMRNVIGEMDLDHALSSRDTINTKLRGILGDATNKWGVKVTRVELKNITPPEDVRITMEKQMTAERNRRAVVLQAEGEKQAAILQAEGQATARLTAATAEAESIRMIAQGITAGQGNPAHYLIMMKYIESLRDLSKSSNSKVVFMPVETSSVLSSIGAFREVFGSGEGENQPVPIPPTRVRQ
jgi:regulator of protease activity HflC (stomatin/prohibitin superfamily)